MLYQTRYLQALYSVGLRKFYLAGIGPLGCTPNQLATGQAQSGRCLDSVNQMLGSFNGGLRSLVDNLNNGGHPGALFVYGNTYGIMGDMLNNRARYGNYGSSFTNFLLFYKLIMLCSYIYSFLDMDAQ